MLRPHLPHSIHYMQTNNVKSLVSFDALHVDEIEKTETSMNPVIVNKEPETGVLFPIYTF